MWLSVIHNCVSGVFYINVSLGVFTVIDLTDVLCHGV